ncbi:MAG: MFS transporter [Burkholderiales bacterium]|nr:MFS transporter [Burkholderiales bacterium]MDP2399129.1 MFS transporter [Burkholderiales bacterium]
MPITLLLFVVLVNMSAFRGSKVLVSLFALELGAPQIMLGVIVALYSLCPMLLALYAGKLSDRLGVRWPLALGSLGIALALLLPGLMPSLNMLYLSALLIGFSFVFYNVSVQSLVGTLSSVDARTRNFSNLSMMIASGGVLGPLIAGLAIDSFGHAAGYLCIAVLPVVSAAILFRAGRGLAALSGGKSKNEEAGGYAVGLLGNVPLRRTLITSGIILTAIDLFQFYMPIYGHAIGLSASAIGMVLAMFAAAAFLVRIILPQIVSRFGEEQVLVSSIFIAAGTYLLFPLVESVLLLAAIAFLLGLGTGCGQPLTLMMIYARAPEGRTGEALGLRMSINNLTHIVVPLFFGAIGTAFGVAPVFLANAVMLGASGMLSRRR